MFICELHLLGGKQLIWKNYSISVGHSTVQYIALKVNFDVELSMFM